MEKERPGFQTTVSEKRELQEKLTKLNTQLLQKQKRCENLESESNKVVEAEKQLMVVRENLTIANKILEDTRANFEGEKKQKRNSF